MTPVISINNLGKKFQKEWIFRHLSYRISPGQKLLISGGNGSGKSTLLQVISGFVLPNEGTVSYELPGHEPASSPAPGVSQERVKDLVSFASPYLQLTEDFTLPEMIGHVRQFKSFLKGLSDQELSSIIQLKADRHKLIRQFSSGMKQRLKLGLAILADTPVLLLDEPVSNLDKEAIAWYREMISTYTTGRTVIVCSNAIGDEHFFCDTELRITDHKPKK